MEKPLLLVREEFMSDLADLINQSRLPFVIIEPILEKFLENARGAIKHTAALRCRKSTKFSRLMRSSAMKNI